MKLSPLVLFVLSAPLASAQWSSNPLVNLSIGDGPSDQNQPKVVATPDGGCYVSWLDGIGTGWDVRLTKLDAAGNEVWGHNGILVRDRGYSSTQDYGLDVDSVGGAVLSFRDDGFGSDQVTVNRVTSSGTLLWGASGVQVTSTTAFIGSPRVTACANGDVVVAWTEGSSGRVMRLLPNGATAWPAPIDFTPSVGSYSPSDLHAHGDDVIVSLVQQTGSSFLSPKHLVAQKLDPLGALLWGPTPIAVFDGGSLQIGNFPTFVPDGAGGAVFSWYGVSPLQCYAQHILANGTEAFPHNGSPGSTNGSNTRVSPSASWDASTSSTYLFWEEQNGTQSLSGLSGQRFDASGNAQWGAVGVSFVGLSATEINWVRTLATATGAFVFWHEIPSFGTDTGHGAVVDTGGTMTVGPVTYAATPSGKSRPASALLASGEVVNVWSDDRADGGDILAQNVLPDGSLGSSITPAYCFGVGCPCGNDDALAGCANSTGTGANLGVLGSPSVSAGNLVLEAHGLPANQPGLYFQGLNAVNGGSGTTFGDGLRCAGGSVVRLQVRTSDAGGLSSTTIDVGLKGGVASGDLRRYQLWYRDPAGSPCGSLFNLTNGVELTWQP